MMPLLATRSKLQECTEKTMSWSDHLHAWLSKPIRDTSSRLVQLRFIFHACRVSFSLSILYVRRLSSIACVSTSISSIGMQVDGPSGKSELLHTCRAMYLTALLATRRAWWTNDYKIV